MLAHEDTTVIQVEKNETNKVETALHGCHCPGDVTVRMRKVLARPWVGVRVCHLLLLLF